MGSQGARDSFCTFDKAMHFCALPVFELKQVQPQACCRGLGARSSPGSALKPGCALLVFNRFTPTSWGILMTGTLDTQGRCLCLQVTQSMPSLFKYEVKAAQAARWVVDGHTDVDNAQQIT